MQAIKTTYDLYTQLQSQLLTHTGPNTESDTGTLTRTVITPSTPRFTPSWPESPLCDGSDDVDEDEAYFLDEDDDDDEDDEYDEDDDEYDDDHDDDNDELDKEEDLDEDDF